MLLYYWIYKTRCEKRYLFSPTRSINSIKYEHSYKILYLLFEKDMNIILLVYIEDLAWMLISLSNEVSKFLLLFSVYFSFFFLSNHWTDCSKIRGYERCGCQVLQKDSVTTDTHWGCPCTIKLSFYNGVISIIISWARLYVLLMVFLQL